MPSSASSWFLKPSSVTFCQAAVGVMHQDRFHGCQVRVTETQRADHIVGDHATGISDDVGLAVAETQHGENVHARVHTGHDCHVAGRAHLQEVAVECLGEAAVAGDQFVRCRIKLGVGRRFVSAHGNIEAPPEVQPQLRRCGHRSRGASGALNPSGLRFVCCTGRALAHLTGYRVRICSVRYILVRCSVSGRADSDSLLQSSSEPSWRIRSLRKRHRPWPPRQPPSLSRFARRTRRRPSTPPLPVERSSSAIQRG